jgi:hypothetical protein
MKKILIFIPLLLTQVFSQPPTYHRAQNIEFYCINQVVYYGVFQNKKLVTSYNINTGKPFFCKKYTSPVVLINYKSKLFDNLAETKYNKPDWFNKK